MAERIFDLEQAEKLLPQLECWLRTAIEGRKKIAEIELEYARLVQFVAASGGRAVDVPHFIRRKQEREEWVCRIRSTAQAIKKSGCLLKDLEMGLVDFPCQVNGQEVYLCWKMGEPSIGFWHNTDEGFAGQKPIDSKFLENTRHPRPN